MRYVDIFPCFSPVQGLGSETIVIVIYNIAHYLSTYVFVMLPVDLFFVYRSQNVGRTV